MRVALKGDMSVAPRKIFVVDDEEPLRKVLSTHLTKEGLHVTLCAGGTGVFESLRSDSFDLVICDIKMPEVDGSRVLEYVRKNMETTPIIMLTGFTDITVAIEIMKKGAFDYLMKPVKKDDLLTTIRRAITHRDLLVRNRELEQENRDYQLFLEQRVNERTKELNAKTIELERTYGLLKNTNIKFVNILAETIEAKDPYTHGHCNRMKQLSVELGRMAGLSASELDVLEYAALLHDLGKVSVNEHILNKEGPLSADELCHIKKHPQVGEQLILDGIPDLHNVAQIIGAHHENFDGSGYPNNLTGKEIPYGARIIAIADTFDAMTSDRPYRKGMPVDKVINELLKVAGTQLDPDLVKLFVEHELHKVITDAI